MNSNFSPQLNYYYNGPELILTGVDKTNPFIYDNDIFYDTVDFYFDIALSKLNGGTMKGIVVTYNILEPHITFQSQMDDANSATQLCRNSNMGTIPDPVFGSPDKLNRPESGNIDDTAYIISEGSKLIVNAANAFGTVEKPLIVYIGGQPTTVAAAYLQDPSIANKVIICHIDPLGYNGADTWATYICTKKMKYFAWGNKVWWWSGTCENQVIVKDPPIMLDSDYDALPDNPVCTYLKTTYKNSWPNNVYHDLGDGAIAIYLEDRTQFPTVQKQNASYDNVCIFTDTNDTQFDVLTVSGMTEDNMRNQGSTFFKVMCNPKVYNE